MTVPVFLPPSLYRAAKRAGIDLTGCAMTRAIPLTGSVSQHFQPITRHLQKSRTGAIATQLKRKF